MSDRLKKAGMFSTDSNFCFSTRVREVVKQSVPPIRTKTSEKKRDFFGGFSMYELEVRMPRYVILASFYVLGSIRTSIRTSKILWQNGAKIVNLEA